jgi:hypothetical protein
VRELASRLDQSGVEVWIDHRDLPVSVDWLEEVRDAITEADLVLVCDSPAWRSSEHCAAESAVAAEGAKRRCVVAVGSDIGIAERAARAALAELDRAESLRTELAVLARDWDRAGRPGARLAAPPLRRRLRVGLSGQRPATAIEQAFLHASRARFGRQFAVSAAVLLAIGVGILAVVVFNAANARISRADAQQAAAYLNSRTMLAGIAADPYQGLYDASLLGGNESGINANVIGTALLSATPDDAFTVPAAAIRFATRSVSGEVTVTDGAARYWQRTASATNTRSAALARPPRGGPSGASMTLTYRRERGSGEVQVLSDGRLWRVLTFQEPPVALALSPDGHELAGAFGADVEIVDVSSGLERTYLRGARGRIVDLAWAADGMRVWALTPGRVVAWSILDGRILRKDPTAAYEGLLPAANRGEVWVVANDGVLAELSLATGSVVASRRVPSTVSTAAGSPDGSVAVVSGARREYLVSLTGTFVHSFAVPGCDAGRPVVPNDATIILPCLGGDLLELSALTGQVERRVAVSPAGVSYATVMRSGGVIVAADENGNLFTVVGSTVTLLRRTECGGRVLRLAVAVGDRAVTGVGYGTGTIGCTPVGLADGPAVEMASDWRWNQMVDVTAGSAVAEAVVFNRTGTIFADGYSDGSIVLHPTVNITPTLTLTSVAGPIRDMLVTDGDELVVATSTGIVQEIPMCADCISNRSLSAVAGRRLRTAVGLGLVPAPPATGRRAPPRRARPGSP